MSKQSMRDGYKRAVHGLAGLSGGRVIAGYSKYSPAPTASLFVGLRAGVTLHGRREGSKIRETEVIEAFKRLRASQIGEVGVAGSFVSQKGVYKGGPPEDSVRIDVFYEESTKEKTLPTFEKHLKEVSQILASKFAQREIYIKWERPSKKRHVVRAGLDSASPIEAPAPGSDRFCAWVRKHSRQARMDRTDSCYPKK